MDSCLPLRPIARLLALPLLTVTLACGGPRVDPRITAVPAPLPTTPVGHAPAAAPARYPALVVTTAKSALFTRGPGSVRFATPRAGLPVTVRETGPDGRELVVQLPGGLEVSGVVARDALAVLVCQPGPVGDALYAGRHNALFLRGPLSPEGRLRVAGEVILRARPYVQGRPYGEQFQRVPVEGELEEGRLCTALPRRPAGTAEDPIVARPVGEPTLEDFPDDLPLVDIVKDEPLTLHAAPGGAPLHTRAGSPWGYALVEVRREGASCLVAAGGGPYLLGWIPARPSRPRKPKGDAADLLGGVVGGTLTGPLDTKALAGLSLHALPAGTELRHHGVVYARLTRPGRARLVKREGHEAYVVAAVDDEVTAQGWIPAAALGPKEELGL